MSQSINPFLSGLILLISGFGLALGLHHLETAQIPGLITSDHMIDESGNASFIDQPSLELVGLEKRLRIDQPGEIDGLWQQFLADNAIHYQLDWRNGQTVFALYRNIDSTAGEADLFIGYGLARFSNPPALPVTRITDGRYQLIQTENSNQAAMRPR